MKISEMILREDFYKINEETLSLYYNNEQINTVLYIYPKINAIITKSPGDLVRKYLYVEYRLRNKAWKRALIFIYLWIVFHSKGLLASKKVTVRGFVNNDDLIYPCNRKYRLFHFEENEVIVMSKKGFSCLALRKEIEFRQKYFYDFILPIISCGENFYSERIIDGVPLARIKKNYNIYVEKAIDKLSQINAIYNEIVDSHEYIKGLKAKIYSQLDEISKYINETEKQVISEIIEKLTQEKMPVSSVLLCMTHGDFQPGNIWIENSTEHLYIIDWESWGIRSKWYDKAVLKCDIRNGNGIKKLLKDEYKDIFKNEDYDVIKIIIAWEDLLYKLDELTGLPGEYGVRQFFSYLSLNYGDIYSVKRGQ